MCSAIVVIAVPVCGELVGRALDNLCNDTTGYTGSGLNPIECRCPRLQDGWASASFIRVVGSTRLLVGVVEFRLLKLATSIFKPGAGPLQKRKKPIYRILPSENLKGEVVDKIPHSVAKLIVYGRLVCLYDLKILGVGSRNKEKTTFSNSSSVTLP